ncbi:MAG: cytochrome c family protein [Nitrospirae bacterium]|nr:cytochrome c family protein [Nitrospirota bacterium]
MARFRKLIVLPVITALAISAMPPSVSHGENRYVGSDACNDCHPTEYKNFITYAKKSKSFLGIQKMKKDLTEKEMKNCYSCHTTGYGKPGGFESPEKTPHLKGAGCEVCHGPGGIHVKSMSRRDIKTRIGIKDCEVCHIAERVSAFRYKPMVHGGAH